MEMVRIASTANATHATMASNEINQVMLDPMPKDAPGLCTSVNERMPGITRTVCPSASADCAHALLIWSSTSATTAIHAKTATRVRSRL